MYDTKSIRPAGSNNLELARKCLTLISGIASRGARSGDPDMVGYALEELSQVLFERTGSEERAFEPVPPDEISTSSLQTLIEELASVNGYLPELKAADLVKYAPRGEWN